MRRIALVLAEDHAAEGLDLLSLVDQLQEAVETSPRLPLSDRVMVSSDWLLDLIDAVRAAIPDDVIEAERLLQSRHRLVEDAREEAEHLLESARDQAKFMLQEHHLVKAAELKAERILSQARREADEIRESADEYVQQLFGRLELEAVRLTEEIRRTAAHRGT